MTTMKAWMAFLAMLPLLASNQSQAQSNEMSGAVFALFDHNEWCPGGSVYLDLRTGAFMLYPRVDRPACRNKEAPRSVEQGTLDLEELYQLREAATKAIDAGLRRDQCAFIISNGGPQNMVITAPGFSDATPDEIGCWSDQAEELHDELFRLFG